MGCWEECAYVHCAAAEHLLCRCLLSPCGLWCHLILKFLSLFFVCWWQWNIEVSHYHCVGGLSVLLSPVVKLGALMLGTYKLTIVISSWCIVPFISIKWPSLYLLTNLSLKSTLFKVRNQWNTEQKQQCWRYHNIQLQTILQSHSNKKSMVLAQNRHKEQ
jgi:hypothetical protein